MILLEREKISATKLAEMFEVTPRTIYRDVETLNSAGIPITAYPGVNGGISIMEQYKIKKRFFTLSDISALLIGLGSIHSTMSSEEILNTMAKVKGLSRISSLELLEDTFVPREFDYKSLDLSSSIEKKSIPIKLLIDKSILGLMIKSCGEENVEALGNDKFIVYFPFVEDEYWYGMILRLGDKCECLEPENVRLEIIRRVENLLNVYKK